MGPSQDARSRGVTVEIMKAQGITEFVQKVMDLTSAQGQTIDIPEDIVLQARSNYELTRPSHH